MTELQKVITAYRNCTCVTKPQKHFCEIWSMIRKSVRGNKIQIVKWLCLSGLDVSLDDYSYFHISIELGHTEMFEILCKFLNHDQADLVFYEQCLDSALLYNRLEIAEKIFQMCPTKFENVDLHIRLASYLGREEDIQMAKFMFTHYAFDDLTVNFCFETVVHLGRKKFVQFFLDELFSVLHPYIIGNRFDWKDLSTQFECCLLIYRKIERQNIQFPFLTFQNFTDAMCDQFKKYLCIRNRTEYRAASLIQLVYRKHIYTQKSVFAQKLAIKEWENLNK